MVYKYRSGKEKYIKQINDIQEWPKETAEFHHSTEKGQVWIKASNYLLNAIYCKKAVETFHVKLLRIIV